MLRYNHHQHRRENKRWKMGCINYSLKEASNRPILPHINNSWRQKVTDMNDYNNKDWNFRSWRWWDCCSFDLTSRHFRSISMLLPTQIPLARPRAFVFPSISLPSSPAFFLKSYTRIVTDITYHTFGYRGVRIKRPGDCCYLPWQACNTPITAYNRVVRLR